MEFWQITLISVWSQTWRWPRCSSCSRDSSTPSIFSVKTCAKCWTLGKSQGPSHLPSQEQGRQGPPAFLGQGLTAEMEDWDVRGWGEPQGLRQGQGCWGCPQDPAVVTGGSLCAHSDKGWCVCKHPACSYKSDLRSMTEHLEVMIWRGNYLMLLFRPISPPSLGSAYFDRETNIMCLCLKEETPWVYVCCLDSLHIKACDSRSSLSSWDRQYQQKQH